MALQCGQWKVWLVEVGMTRTLLGLPQAEQASSFTMGSIAARYTTPQNPC